MSFSTVPKANPTMADSGTNVKSEIQQSARERAISRLMESAPQHQATPPEVRAAQAARPEPIEAEPEARQTPSSEEAPAEELKATDSAEEIAPEAPKKAEEPISSQYAVLARKEKQLRVKAQQQELAFKQREESLRQRESEYSRKDAEYSSGYIQKDRLAKDPIGTLLDAGISYDQITELALNQPQVDPATKAYLAKLEAKLAKLEGDHESTRKGINDNQTQSYQQALRQIELDAKALVESDPAFETIKAAGAYKDVKDLIEKTFKEDGTLLSVEQAAQLVEEELVEEAMKIARLTKIQQRLKPTSASAPKATDDPKKSPEMKTLTNAIGASRQLSAKERAVLAFQGKLNK